MFRWLDPLAGAVEVRDNVDCANDCVGRYVHGYGSLDDGLESQTNGGGAAGEKSGGVGMAVHGGVVGDAVILGDAVGTAPAEEVALDGVAVGMAADSAFAAVAAACARATASCFCTPGKCVRRATIALFGQPLQRSL